MKAVSRDPFAFRARIGQAIFFGILTNFVYWGIGGEYDPVGIQNMAGCNYFLLVGQWLTWLFGSLLSF